MLADVSEVILFHKLEPMLLLSASLLNEVVAAQVSKLGLKLNYVLPLLQAVKVDEPVSRLDGSLSCPVQLLGVLLDLIYPLCSSN